jgi:tetratricopeptide (TPR) repeat protein
MAPDDHSTHHERNGHSSVVEGKTDCAWFETAKPLIEAVACHDMALVRKYASELIETNEDKDIAYSTVARAFWAMGQLDVALEYYGIALALEPRSWLHYRSIGRLLRQMGRSELGAKIIERGWKVVKLRELGPGVPDRSKKIHEWQKRYLHGSDSDSVAILESEEE